MIRGPFQYPGEISKPETFKVIPDVEVERLTSGDDCVRKSNQIFIYWRV
jgi:hypothetical protein